VATARAALAELGDRLEAPLPVEARPGADLWVRIAGGLSLPPAAPLLRAADGWVHPGPPTAWPMFVAMTVALGAHPPTGAAVLPDIGALSADQIDAEAGAWQLPAVAVRREAAMPPVLPPSLPASGSRRVRGATVVVLGTAWATPLVGLILRELGADVVRVENPRRPDPFPLADRLARGQRRISLDLDVATDREQFARVLGGVDLLVDGHTRRVRDNADLGDERLACDLPALAILRVAAFASGDRPGYGFAAESRGGWAARHDPPRLGRSSIADPVAGVLGALAAIDLLAEGRRRARGRVSLEAAVGHLLESERGNG
jgi:hypothetical protein